MPGRRDVRVEQRPELVVEVVVGESQPFAEVVGELDRGPRRRIDRLEPAVQVHARAGEPAQVNVVAAVLAGHVRVAGEARGGRGQIRDGGKVDAHLVAVKE